jgi:hypothetical protein
VEYLSTDRQTLQIDAGLAVHGNASRRPEITPKHGLRLVFRGKYGRSTLEAPLFDGSPVTEFDDLVLRPLLDDSVFAVPHLSQYVRDQWIRDTQLAMGSLAPRGRFVHVYLNGLYWGLYNLTERITDDYADRHLGEDDYDVVSEGEARDGDLEAWLGLLALLESGVETDEAYADVARHLDIDDFIDYLLLQFYAAPQDWPGFNWTAVRPRRAGGQFRFLSWDGEWSMVDPFVDRTGTAKSATPGALHARLRRSAEFQRRFAERATRHLGPGGALYVDPAAPAWDPSHPQRNVPAARYAALAGLVEDAVVAEAARWGDWKNANEPPYSRDRHWRPERDRMLGAFFPQRSAILAEQLRARGLFPE